MDWLIELTLFLILIIAALIALGIRDLLVAAVILSVFSFVTAAIMVSLGAIDVAFTEAVVGAGAVGLFSVVVIRRTSRRSED